MSTQTQQERFTDWMQSQYKETTVERYLRDFLHFTDYGHERCAIMNFTDIMEYIGHLRGRYTNGRTIQCMLHPVRAYYRWLEETGQRSDNPTTRIKLRDARQPDIQLDKLMTPEELRCLSDGVKGTGQWRIRSRVVMSLLVCQGLTKQEMTSLKVCDVDLQKGVIRIGSPIEKRERALPLEGWQAILLHEYITGLRKKKALPEVEELLISTKGEALSGYCIRAIIYGNRQLAGGKHVNNTTIRQSVARNLLKTGHNVRAVQKWMGHANPSVTERYRETGLAGLQKGVALYHPL